MASCNALSSNCGDDDNTVDDDNNDSDDDDSTQNDDDDNDDDDSGSGVWTDSSSGLMWQIEDDQWYTWLEAKALCENLDLGGYSDWRLPSISELRTLIRGCSDTETGGECGVTDECLDSGCWNVPCEGCLWDEGPARGCYWPSELNPYYYCYTYWSSTLLEDHDNYAWQVRFYDGEVDFSVIEYSENVRCVRNAD